MPGDIPQSGPGMPSRSRIVPEASQNNFNAALVPGEPNALTPQRVEAQSVGDATHVEGRLIVAWKHLTTTIVHLGIGYL
jgi:hypothetical protein